MTRRNLILVGGIFHDFQASAEALSTVLEPLGIESRIEPDLDAGVANLAQQPVDLVTLNAHCAKLSGGVEPIPECISPRIHCLHDAASSFRRCHRRYHYWR